MKQFSFSGLRLRLIILVLMAVIPALGLTFYSFIEHRRQTAQEVKSNALILTRLAAAKHELYIEASHQLLIALTQLHREGISSKVSFNTFLSHLVKQYPHYANLGAVNPNGDLLYSAIPSRGPINYSDRSWFKNALKMRIFVVGDYVIGRLTGKGILPFAYPYVGDTGRIEAVFFGAIDLEWLNKLVAKTELPEGAALTLVDANGTIIARYPEPEKWVGKSLRDTAIIKTILTHGEGTAEMAGVDGIQRLYAFSPLVYKSEARAHISIGMPTTLAYAESNRELMRNLIALSIVALLAMAAAWFVGGAFVIQPVNRLLKTTAKLTEGDLTARTGPYYGSGEINQLAHAFDQMAESLQCREDDRKRAEEETRLLQIMTQVIAESQDFNSALKIALQKVCETTGWVLGEAWVPSSDCKHLEFSAVWTRIEGLEKFIEESKKFLFPPGIGLPGRVWLSKEPVWVQDVTSDSNFPRASHAREAGLKGAMAIPILDNDEVVAIVDFFVLEVREEDERLIKVISAVAIQLGSLIQRKRADESLKNQKEMFQNVIDNIPAIIVMYDAKGEMKLINQEFVRLMGWTAEEVRGIDLMEKCYPDPEYRKMAWEYMISATMDWREFKVTTRDGGILESIWSNVRLSDGTQIGIGIDITERKRAEEEKRILEEQFRQSQKMEAIGKLAGGVAHDFNNLLTIIKGYCQLSLPAIKGGDPLKENIEEVMKAADRAADLTRQLLAFSRRQVMEVQVLDLNTILKNLDKMLRRMIGEDIELATLLSEDLGRVKADPGQIEQVIMNLIVNARDAMPRGGKLTIETANGELDETYARTHVAVTPGPHVMFAVSDTGVGMTPEVRERVFEPFFTTKEKGKGTGLGLSTVYGIVKQSNGNIWVYSEAGKGTTFKIYLPRVDEPAEELRVKVERPELPRGSETILVVEDDEKVLKLTLKILEKQGYEVLGAGSGNEALEICKEGKKPIHLVLTDVVMPGLDGRQLAEKLREVCQGFKVLYMSGYTDNAISHHGILEEGLDFIQKPLSVEGLVKKVREVLDK
ncbi:MAG: response regulator [Deltaproteobacteria bacterium]|nr:response regulator [Deltaproteobacteria bacterium]